jgi:subtilase family serine protease
MKGLGLLVAGIVCAVVVFAAGAGAANGHASYRAVCPGPVFDSGRCHAAVVTDARGNPQASGGPTGYGPAQFQAAYTLPSAVAGAGQTIAIVDAYDDPKADADLATYSLAYGLPACTTANGCFRKVDQTGGKRYPRADQGWALEISLDVQIAHAICPNCKILLVEAKTNSFANLIAAEDYATAHANVVSNSWGGGEFSSETSSSYDGHFNRPGVPITVSSGDAGYGAEFPAASRYVTAVGGTTLTLGTDNSRLSETAWSGAGSGCSSYETKPAWQTDSSCARRTVADVSADADPSTGASVYDSQGYQGRAGWFTVGGTSLSAPLIAGVYALAGNASSTTYASFLYSHTGSLYDVTSGTNGSCSGNYLCTAQSGYDGPTGLGTPNGTGAF